MNTFAAITLTVWLASWIIAMVRAGLKVRLDPVMTAAGKRVPVATTNPN